MWNVGTGYFGCRGEDGSFDADRFRENATRPNVEVCRAWRCCCRPPLVVVVPCARAVRRGAFFGKLFFSPSLLPHPAF